MQISLYGQTHRSPYFLKLGETEITKLCDVANHQPKESILAVKLTGIPRPVTVWGKELDLCLGIHALFLATVEFRQPVSAFLVK